MVNNTEYIKLLNSNKFSVKEKKLLFIGILSSTICNRTIFEKNIDLKEYINMYEKVLNIEPYREYLYDSRTLLSARLIRDFMDVGDSFIIKECFKAHINFIENSERFRENNKETKGEKKVISKNGNLLTDMINRDKEYE